MHQQQAPFQVRCLCQLLEGARRGYDAWRSRPPRAPAQVAQEGQAKIPYSCAPGRGPSGTRRIQPRLAPDGLQGSRRRLGRLLAQAGLRCQTRRTGKALKPSGQAQTGAPHQRHREGTGQAPETVSVGDIPSLPTGAGWLDRAVVLERCSRAVGGWSMANHMRAELGPQAFARALGQRPPAAGLSMPTDRGSQ
jgi:transposase InsO family protein